MRKGALFFEMIFLKALCKLVYKDWKSKTSQPHHEYFLQQLKPTIRDVWFRRNMSQIIKAIYLKNKWITLHSNNRMSEINFRKKMDTPFLIKNYFEYLGKK